MIDPRGGLAKLEATCRAPKILSLFDSFQPDLNISNWLIILHLVQKTKIVDPGNLFIYVALLFFETFLIC